MSENDTEKTATALPSTDNTTDKKPQGKQKHKRLIKSISHRMMLDYFVFAAVILALLWIAFFVGLFNFYSAIVREDVRRVGEITAAAFPKRVDDNSMLLYKLRLRDTARDDSVAILVFERIGEDGFKILEAIDIMGNDSEISDSNPSKDVMINIDFDNALASHNNTGTVNTEYGEYVYYVSEHRVADGYGERTLDMVILKPYDVFNYQTNKLLAILGGCTVVVLVLACVCAFVAGRMQTKYLTDFSKKAKRVADGDYDIKYSGYGYTEYEILANALNDATQNVKSAEKLQRDFIANVSHDIRTPITIIRAYAEMIRDLPQGEEKRKQTAGTIISEADKLTTLTNDVLNYSRLSSGAVEFVFEPNDISAIAHSALLRFEFFAERDGMKFVADIDDGITVNCDKDQIEQVLYNLISNACNYCGDDKTVILNVKNIGGVARVEVIDHGKGIAKEDIDAIWDRYYRAAHAKRKTVGTGLGLSICNNILKAHDARFGVESELGKGSTFWFELDVVKK